MLIKFENVPSSTQNLESKVLGTLRVRKQKILDEDISIQYTFYSLQLSKFNIIFVKNSCQV